MNIAWEKVILWVIGAIVLIIVVTFMVYQLQPEGSGFVGNFFSGVKEGAYSP